MAGDSSGQSELTDTPSAALTAEPAVFNQAYYVQTRGQSGDRADLYCLVMARRPGSRTTFWDVTDGTMTSTVQVGVASEDFSDHDYEQIRSIRKGARLRVSGRIGSSHRGQQTIWLDAMPAVQSFSFPETLEAVEPHRHRIGASMFVARFRSLAERVLEKREYVPIGVRLLAQDWHDTEGPYTLKALYPGFGLPMFLALSPSPQLVEALIATGANRVFASSSLFTSSYRERPDGSEASVIMAKTLDCALEKLVEDAILVFNHVLEGIGAVEVVAETREWRRIESSWPTQFPVDEVQEPQILSYAQELGDASHVLRLARFLIPPGVAPIEVSTEVNHQGVPLGTIVFYLERMLPIVRHLPIRRLHSIAPLFPSMRPDESPH